MPARPDDMAVNPQVNIYHREFWIAYLANLLLVTGNSMTFRFADWVVLLGGTNSLAGLLVSFGVLGAILSRLGLMHLIDRHGTRWQWIICSALFSLGILGILFSPAIGYQLWISRICYAIGVAGMFTCSVVHVQIGVPLHRRTEIIGMLGSSGFLGLMIGGILGDRIYHYFPHLEHPTIAYQSVFATAVIFGLVYLGLVIYLTRKDEIPEQQEKQDVFSALANYSPGYTLIIACLMGMGYSVTFVFLTRFATLHHLEMGAFYALYAMSAFTFRLLTKNWNRLIGRYQMIIRGLFAHILGQSLLSMCSQEWHFLFPAVACGLGHALLFPAVVSLGAGAFPTTSRGIGTTLVMGFIDVGGLIFAPLLGYIIDEYGFAMMYCMSILIHLIVVMTYYWKYNNKWDSEQIREIVPVPEEPLVKAVDA